MAKPQIRSLLKRLTRHHSSPEPPMIPSHVPAQSEPGKSQPTPLSAPSRLASKPESASSLDLRERIWKQAYDESRQEEPDLVEALENIVLAQLCNNEKRTGFSSLIQGRERIDRKVTLCEVQEFVWDRIERMEKETSIKQDISGALQAMQAIRGIINGAIRAAPEAAAVWATVCLSVEVLSNPITEALENRKGLQYVVGKMEWYWNLADLLLDKNQFETTTAKMQGELEREMVHLFQKLLLYQMRSIRLYHHNRPTTITRDTFRIGDWTGQLNNIKKAEETVERHIDQCNIQESKIWLQSLKDTTGVLQQSLQNIEKTAQKQIEQRAKTHKDDHDKQCLSDLHITDPQMDRRDIEEQKGGLLKDCYEWIFNHRNFRRFQSETESRILWIRGHVGKGKTMVLCGLINELESYSPAPVAYFFCQAIHGWRLSAATSVLRGLIYHLARQNPQLTKYVREKYDDHKNVFNSADAWKNLCEIMTQMLNDPILENVILIVDALDECSQELESLLGFITRPSSAKWILSSRNWSYIERRLDATEQTVKIHLELNPDPLSKAVGFYINARVERLAKDNGYDEAMKNAVLEYLIANAQDTFLWVALACQELSNLDPMKQHTLSALETLPPGIDPLYKRMLKRICQSEDGPICREVLATALTVYQPITLQQLAALVEELEDYGEREVKDIITSCSPFLTLRDNFVYFVHHSAKDYLLRKASDKVLPSGVLNQHKIVFERSLDFLCRTLKRDIYNLQDPGCLIDQVSAPDPDPLATIQYSCFSWVSHLRDSETSRLVYGNDKILAFFKQKYLHWLEAASLLHSFPAAAKVMAKLEFNLHENASQELRDIIKDARRFLLFHGRAIEVAPLQAYVSAMIFSPTASLTRKHFSHEQPDWVELKPKVGEDSNPCLQTLGGHCDNVTSVVFSHDGQQLASGSGDKTVKIWEPESGACMQTFEGHDDWVRSVAFSHDGQRLASSSDDKTVKIWDVASGACLRTLEGHEDRVKSAVFSNDGRRIVSGSDDETVKIWDAISGKFLQTLEDHHSWVISVVFSHDGRRLASGSADETIKIWDPTSGACLRTLRGHCRDVVSVVFSNDGQRLASGSDDKTVKIWDPDSGECLLTLEGHDRWVTSVAFSNDGQRLASVSWDKTTKIWDANSGACLQILEGHDGCVTSVVFSPDSQRLASGSADETVKIWNATSGTSLQTLEGHHNYVSSVVLSNDGQRLASGSTGKTLKIWDPTSGTCLKTLEGHHLSVSSVVFSNDGQQLASGSRDNTLKIWDVTSGSCLQTLKGHDGWITSVVFSHNNQRLASGSADETIKIWNAASGACLKTFRGHRHSVASMAFSKDGQRLALGSWDGTIRIWDGTSGACLQTLEGHDYWVTSVMFSNDGWQLASRSADRTAKIWDVISGTCLRTLPTSDTTYYAPSDPGFLDAGISVAVSVPSIHQSSLIHSNPYSYGFSDDNSWITKDGRKLVWLPLDYRPLQSSAVAGTRLALVCPPNRIIVIGFRSTDWHEKSMIQLNHR